MSEPDPDDLLITGLGVVTPIGESVESFWDSNLVGRSGLRRETRMDLSGLPGGWVAGVLNDAVREAVTARSGAPGRSWGDTLLHDTVGQAIADARVDRLSDRPAGLVWTRVWPGPTGPYPADYADYARKLGEQVTGRSAFPLPEPPELFDRTSFPAEMSQTLGVPLLATRVEATCAGGLRCVIEAARLLRLGRVGLAVICASVSRNTPYVLSQYAQLRALSRWRGKPELASMPFDRRRTGMVINESAGAIILETAGHAAARGVTDAYAVLRGWGLALTTDHVTAPNVDAVEDVMRTAIAHARLNPADITTVNAHGTSTKLNDLVEAQAMHRVFGDRTPEVPVCAVKSLTGHGSAASGIVETVAAALTLNRGIIPPVVTCQEPDPACGVTTLPHPLIRRVDTVVKNSFGFGGQYASIVLGRSENPRRSE